MSRRGITVIVPTVGRETLKDTLVSINEQVNPEDTVYVVGEEFQSEVLNLVSDMADDSDAEEWMYEFREGGHWGHANRNAILNKVDTSHVWTIDDDDLALPGAMKAMREHMDDPWTIFKMTFGAEHHAFGVTLWFQEQVVPGNVGTPMIFAPTSPARFGLEYMGDYAYAKDLQGRFGEPVWAEELVAIIRP